MANGGYSGGGYGKGSSPMDGYSGGGYSKHPYPMDGYKKDGYSGGEYSKHPYPMDGYKKDERYTKPTYGGDYVPSPYGKGAGSYSPISYGSKAPYYPRANKYGSY